MAKAERFWCWRIKITSLMLIFWYSLWIYHCCKGLEICYDNRIIVVRVMYCYIRMGRWSYALHTSTEICWQIQQRGKLWSHFRILSSESDTGYIRHSLIDPRCSSKHEIRYSLLNILLTKLLFLYIIIINQSFIYIFNNSCVLIASSKIYFRIT